MTNTKEYIKVYGAREHNLKNISVDIPRDELVVITGLSGSGKSSLAFDTIYAEGQRRYIESFSVYARQYLGNLEKPDVDSIEGLSPVVSIEQKTTSKSPRSTVGTITEIYDLLRLLFARSGTAYSYETGEEMVRFTTNQIIEKINSTYKKKKIVLYAPLIKGRKGHYRELFEKLCKQGFLKVRVDGKIIELTKGYQVDRYKIHDIEVVIDRLDLSSNPGDRLKSSVDSALKLGNGILMAGEHESDDLKYYSRNLMCPTSGLSYPDPEPNLFSFNSPYGACPHCKGLGSIPELDESKIIPHKNLSIKSGAILPLGKHRDNWIFAQLENLCIKHNSSILTPIKELPEELMNEIFYGEPEGFQGILNLLEQLADEQEGAEKWLGSFSNYITCKVCNGARLNKIALHFKVGGSSMQDLVNLDISDFYEWIIKVSKKLTENQLKIGNEIIKEIKRKTEFLVDIGLHYLTLNRGSKGLSGGESQRIRLASQIGSDLVGVLYILDEPSIGLHQKDNIKLIAALKKLRDGGNSVLVVEHDKEMIEAADYVIDVGPGAGVHGGQIIDAAHPSKLSNIESTTYQYLKGIKKIEVPKSRRKGNGKFLTIKGASGNNLKNVTLNLPLGKLVCVTGLSGSGKSTLINETLFPSVNQYLNKGSNLALPYKSIDGLENIDKIIQIDQSPIGRTPRSNPATYTDVYTDIRNLYALLPDSKIKGFKANRFSFNISGGRCEECKGAGVKKVEMNFLPDVLVQCETCSGKRFNQETLRVKYKGKNINDVLNLSINDSTHFFENHPKIYQKLKTLQEVGLGYINLGQPSTTLSGGEAQRIKLASELSKKDTGKTLYILDEPTTGLHFEDIRILTDILHRLADKGNSVLVIEHNLDVIKLADYIFDMGPEGGKNGGHIVAEGTPEQISKNKKSITGTYLKQEL
ncbi:MAG: excinuclease ABC subunit UvrA [Bacteroidetes bacterium]|nr:excinuclease ABC subunit UvrA [Bacteroidota bacterium]